MTRANLYDWVVNWLAAGTLVSKRQRVNFIDSAVAWTITDDAANAEVEVLGAVSLELEVTMFADADAASIP